MGAEEGEPALETSLLSRTNNADNYISTWNIDSKVYFGRLSSRVDGYLIHAISMQYIHVLDYRGCNSTWQFESGQGVQEATVFGCTTEYKYEKLLVSLYAFKTVSGITSTLT